MLWTPHNNVAGREGGQEGDRGSLLLVRVISSPKSVINNRHIYIRYIRYIRYIFSFFIIYMAAFIYVSKLIRTQS